MDLARKNVYGTGVGGGLLRIIVIAGRPVLCAICACPISAECAARNFEIAKQAELIPQQVYHIDQHKNWTSVICFVAYSTNFCAPPLPRGTTQFLETSIKSISYADQCGTTVF